MGIYPYHNKEDIKKSLEILSEVSGGFLMPIDDLINKITSTPVEEVIKQDLNYYFNNNKIIKSILKEQIIILYNLIKYCKADDYDSEIKLFVPEEDDNEEKILNQIKGVLIIDKSLKQEIVYLITPEYILPLDDCEDPEHISFKIRSIKQDKWKPRNEYIHWFDDCYNEYGDKFMTDEATYCKIIDVLTAECFTMVLHSVQVQDVMKIYNNKEI